MLHILVSFHDRDLEDRQNWVPKSGAKIGKKKALHVEEGNFSENSKYNDASIHGKLEDLSKRLYIQIGCRLMSM